MNQIENNNIFYPAIAVRDKDVTFGEGRRCGSTMQDLAKVIMETEGLSQMPSVDDIEVIQFSNRPVIRLNRVVVGVLLWPPKEYQSDFAPSEPPKDLPVHHVDRCPDVSTWFDILTKYATETHDRGLLAIIDSAPEDLVKVGKTHVIVPDSEHMTDEMVDATRGLLLHFDTNHSHNAEDIKKSLARHPWTLNNVPEWFKEDSSHVTKAGRAILMHHLTLAAYTNPPKEEEKYFGSSGVRQEEFCWGVFVVLRHKEDEVSIGLPFSILCNTNEQIADGHVVDFKINRHEIPEEWRAYFKKQAITIKGTVRVNGDAMGLTEYAVTMGLKDQCLEAIGARLEQSVKLPLNPIRA